MISGHERGQGIGIENDNACSVIVDEQRRGHDFASAPQYQLSPSEPWYSLSDDEAQDWEEEDDLPTAGEEYHRGGDASPAVTEGRYLVAGLTMENETAKEAENDMLKAMAIEDQGHPGDMNASSSVYQATMQQGNNGQNRDPYTGNERHAPCLWCGKSACHRQTVYRWKLAKT